MTRIELLKNLPYWPQIAAAILEQGFATADNAKAWAKCLTVETTESVSQALMAVFKWDETRQPATLWHRRYDALLRRELGKAPKTKKYSNPKHNAPKGRKNTAI